MNINIRPILPSDNAALAVIIRSALKEFGANHPGTGGFALNIGFQVYLHKNQMDKVRGVKAKE